MPPDVEQVPGVADEASREVDAENVALVPEKLANQVRTSAAIVGDAHRETRMNVAGHFEDLDGGLPHASATKQPASQCPGMGGSRTATAPMGTPGTQEPVEFRSGRQQAARSARAM